MERFTNQTIGKFRIKYMFVVFLFCFNKQTGIKPLGSFYQCCYDNRRKTFAIAYNCSRSLWRQITYKIYSLKNIFQFTQQFIHTVKQQFTFLSCRNDGINHFYMTVYNLLHLLFITGITVGSHSRSLNQLISYTTQC